MSAGEIVKENIEAKCEWNFVKWVGGYKQRRKHMECQTEEAAFSGA